MYLGVMAQGILCSLSKLLCILMKMGGCLDLLELMAVTS